MIEYNEVELADIKELQKPTKTIEELKSNACEIGRYFLFEFNDVIVRAGIADCIRGCLDTCEEVKLYMVQCDELNNTDEVIDRNELVVDIYFIDVNNNKRHLHLFANSYEINMDELLLGEPF